MSRWKYFLKRVALAVPVIVFSMSIMFVLLRLGPIDPASAIVGQGDPRQIAIIRSQLGLDKPLWVQYYDFMVQLFTFDLGRSWVVANGWTVYDLIIERAPRTIWLGFWSVVLAVFVGIPLGFYAGLRPNTLNDYFASFGGIVWRAMPNFWLGIILVEILSSTEQLFGFSWQGFIVQTTVITPPDLSFFTNPMLFISAPGATWHQFLVAFKSVLPAAIVLGSSSMGNEMRIGRTAVLETINSNYIETAKAKGLSSRTIVWKHIFRNALIPLVPILTGEAVLLIGGSVVIELVFGWKGMGQLFLSAITSGDIPLAGALMYLFVLLLVIINIIQDLLYTIIDPRVGYERE